ncbi:DinB family protein [Pedobacter caeni]|nr:DinB family protein [Pedobacter caeni]
MSIEQSTTRLQYLCDTIPALLTNIPEADFSRKPAPVKWSNKEMLGHLIDSATNNHQRFVRAQFEESPTIVYDQNNWNTYSHYNQLDSKQLILFWETYNRHLLALIQNIAPENLSKTCSNGGEASQSIEWLFIDYVAHMEHHLKQMLTYSALPTRVKES